MTFSSTALLPSSLHSLSLTFSRAILPHTPNNHTLIAPPPQSRLHPLGGHINMSIFQQILAQGHLCNCDVCKTVFESWIHVNAVVTALSGERESASQAIVRDVKRSIENACMELHRLHQPNRRHSKRVVTTPSQSARQPLDVGYKKTRSTSKHHRRGESVTTVRNLHSS